MLTQTTQRRDGPSDNGRNRYKLFNLVMNDRCVAETGSFLKVMAPVIELALEGIGELSLQARDEIRINSTCTVFR